MSNNLSIWNQVEKTKKSMTKPVGNGNFKFTAIDAHSQIQKATETFGPCGQGWGVRNQCFDTLVTDPNDPHYSLLLYTAELWWKRGDDAGSFEIAADIELFEYSQKNGWRPTKDPSKKVRTDALTKGLSWLGFNADVFLGRFDDAKYVAQLEAEERQEQRAQAKGKATLDELTTLKKQIFNRSKVLSWDLDALEQFSAITVNRTLAQLDLTTAKTLLHEIKKTEEVSA